MLFNIKKILLKNPSLRSFVYTTKKRVFYVIQILKYFNLDLKNLLIYVRNAPFACETIYINPNDVKLSFNNFLLADRKDSGKVIDGNWDIGLTSFTDLPKYRHVYDHFIGGQSWEDVGAYKFMEDLVSIQPGADGCYTFEDIIKKYKSLDNLFEEVKSTNRLLNVKELRPRSFRERGGIYIHLDRDCNPIFAGGGGTYALNSPNLKYSNNSSPTRDCS